MPASADAQHLSESLGQPLDRCVVALRRCHEDVEAAAAYLMEFMDFPDEFWLSQSLDEDVDMVSSPTHQGEMGDSNANDKSMEYIMSDPDTAAAAEADPEIDKILRESMQDAEGEVGKASGPSRATEGAPREAGMKPAEFDRFTTSEEVDEEGLKNINEYCNNMGTNFVDPAFPPLNRSLYFDEASATHWTCQECHYNGNPLPNEDPQEEVERDEMRREMRTFFQYIEMTNPVMAEQMRQNPGTLQIMYSTVYEQKHGRPPPTSESGSSDGKKLVCSRCKAEAGFVVLQARPSQWLRPVDIRDDVTMEIGGTPWEVIRGEPSPDDIRQGALGNCWFVGALSLLAQKPRLVESILSASKAYNPVGAYVVRLCRDGVWHNVVVDDTFPCTRLGMLAYTKAARRQLWVPLIEKAAAKLFGCYEALNSGTISEAMSLFTGYPTTREILFRSPEWLARKNEELKASGSDMTAEEEWKSELEVLWARLLTSYEAGHLLGLACAPTFRHSRAELKDHGLQAPHAYSVMNVREVGENRLVLLRNPWGIQSPRSWNGAWSRDSDKWTDELKRELGVVNSAGVSMYDSNSMFWMDWEDVVEYFASLEICRVHEDYPSDAVVRQRCWLPALTGLGEMFTVAAPDDEDASVDITVYQESNKTRESAVGMASTLVDIGLVIIRVDPNSGEPLECIGTAKKDIMPEVNTELFLKRGETYRIVPLSFSHSMELGHRRSTVAIHSSHALKSVSSPRRMSSIESGLATFFYAVVHGKRKEVSPAGIAVYICQDSSGTIVCVENKRTDCSFVIELDASESKSVVSSRGSMTTQDTIPPMTRAVLMTLSPEKNATKFQLSLAMAHGVQPGDGGGGIFFPPPTDITMHVFLPISQQPVPHTVSHSTAAEGSTSSVSPQQRVKALFDEYVASGMAPNDALLAALAAMKK